MDEQDDRWIAAAASALLAAERERISIEALTVQRPDLSLAMAYRVQAAAVARQVAGGARVVGHKAGVTSRAMQEQMGVDEPDSGVLLDHMVLPTGSTMARCALMQPRVEAEIAFRLGCDLTGENVGFEEARAAVKTPHAVKPSRCTVGFRSQHRRDDAREASRPGPGASGADRVGAAG
ncbi:2-keto-4-pentenoate hydratase [Streptomyces werraensis]|uniref:2-keto-4-pentenoate hydratase n=1 Tax=Streptomyces werraensis TaxID=68284 RepID=UPI0037F9EBFD